MTVERLLNEMSSDELLMWQGMYLIDPWDTERIERSIATLTAVYQNSLLTEKQRDKARSVDDYMPFKRMREASRDNKKDSPTLPSFLSTLRRRLES